MRFRKDPDAVLDYWIDWSDWLNDDDVISQYSVLAQSGIEVDDDELLNNRVTLWLSGGSPGNVYEVTCRVTTALGRTDDRSIIIICADK
jgi:hypothetical protein